MYKTLFALALAVFTTASHAASQQKDVMVPVHQFVDGFNKGDVKGAVAACADQTSIIDEFPPHEWHGAGACEKWANDYDADAKKHGVTGGIVTLGRPRHVDVTDNYAYVVVPANYKFKQNGKTVEEASSTLTVALEKGATGWRITAWTWTKQ
ncbi:MAG TPA: nuclear transport factor 2 family protein [Gemmatimonadales bacterium]|jgi:ketosteroid isomerase-like protein|nr:nuclear transport factor 2 family protein [Gemmatimonadales bacterium]